jgi:hypothetical protein
VPEGKKPREVHLLTAGVKPLTRNVGAFLEVTVPSILVHEVVAVDL